MLFRSPNSSEGAPQASDTNAKPTAPNGASQQTSQQQANQQQAGQKQASEQPAGTQPEGKQAKPAESPTTGANSGQQPEAKPEARNAANPDQAVSPEAAANPQANGNQQRPNNQTPRAASKNTPADAVRSGKDHLQKAAEAAQAGETARAQDELQQEIGRAHV